MTTEDENKTISNGAGFNGQPNAAGPAQPAGSGEPVAPGQPHRTGENSAPSPHAYYEPWQQPVYNNSGRPAQNVFSPDSPAAPPRTRKRRRPAKPEPQEKVPLLRQGCRLVVACALASGGATYGVIQLSGGTQGTGHQVILGSTLSSSNGGGQSAQATSSTASGTAMTSSEIYDMATKQGVGVNSRGMTTNIFGQQSPSAGSGSGFIGSQDGYIVTNYHVVSYAAKQNFKLTVMLYDGSSYPAKIIGSDKDNDVAVIKIDATGLNAVTLGTNKDMKVGDTVYAVGNPLGELVYSMTSGIVSALDRVIQVDETTSINMFQIDAAVNSGNSGGPVYNANGQVIGIVSAKYASTGVEGLGFAIPIDDAIDIVQQLISTGYVSGKPSMGVSVRDITSATAEYYNLHTGAYVEAVTAGSAADKAGNRQDDIGAVIHERFAELAPEVDIAPGAGG
jgi:serine protease Do